MPMIDRLWRLSALLPSVKRLLILALPAAITGGITQINQLIGTAIASAQDSAVSSLAYADRIYQLPLGVVGVAVAIVLLPELSRALKSGNLIEAANLQKMAKIPNTPADAPKTNDAKCLGKITIRAHCSNPPTNPHPK